MQVRFVVLLALASAVLAVPRAVHGQESVTIKILHFSDLAGAFSPLTCTTDAFAPKDYSSFVARLDREAATGPHVIVGTGNVLGDEPFSMFLLNQGSTGVASIATLLKRTHADVLVPGLTELSLPYRGFLEYWPSLESASVPYRAANVSCEQGTSCPVPAPGVVMLERAGVRIALLPLVGPAVASVVHPHNVSGLKFASPLDTASGIALLLKAHAQADLVIAIVNMETEPGPAPDTLAFLSQVQGVDLILTGGLALPDGLPIFDHVDAGGRKRPFLAASPRAPDYVGVVTLRVAKTSGGFKLDTVETSIRPVDPLRRDEETEQLLSQTLSEFCSLASRTLGTGEIDPPMEPDTLLKYAMEVARRNLECDVSLFSRDSIRLRKERIEGAPDYGLIFRAFPKHEVVVLDVLGSDLAAFAPAVFDGRNGLLSAGISRDAEGNLRINDRPLNPARRYSIATSDFLASAGKGLLKTLLDSPMTRKEPSGYFLVELVQRHFEKDGFAKLGGRKIDVATNFEPLWDLPLWELSSMVYASFTNIAISNDSGYEETQLVRSPFLGFSGDGQATVTRSTRDQALSDFVRVQYAMARTSDEGDLAESQDLITEELTFSWLTIRNRMANEDPLVPVPLVKAKAETEFSQSPDTEYHHLELTGVAGIQWLFGTRAAAGVGYGLRTEALAPDDTLHPGAQIHYTITSLQLYQGYGARAATLDSRFELFYSDWTTSDTLKGTGSTKLSIAVWDPLSFTLGLDVFLFRTGSGDLSWSLDTTVGLTLTAESAAQEF